MVKVGGPCQAQGELPNTICGATEISDKSSWRRGGKYKPEHQGKLCCTKRPCRIYLGVIEDPKAAESPAAAEETAIAGPTAAPTPPTPLLPAQQLLSPTPLQPSPLAQSHIAVARYQS